MVPSLQSVVFTAENTRYCVDIAIEDDTAVESNEVCTVSLSTGEERVTIDPGSADITIIDNNCKHHKHRFFETHLILLQLFRSDLREMVWYGL